MSKPQKKYLFLQIKATFCIRFQSHGNYYHNFFYVFYSIKGFTFTFLRYYIIFLETSFISFMIKELYDSHNNIITMHLHEKVFVKSLKIYDGRFSFFMNIKLEKIIKKFSYIIFIETSFISFILKWIDNNVNNALSWESLCGIFANWRWEILFFINIKQEKILT